MLFACFDSRISQQPRERNSKVRVTVLLTFKSRSSLAEAKQRAETAAQAAKVAADARAASTAPRAAERAAKLAAKLAEKLVAVQSPDHAAVTALCRSVAFVKLCAVRAHKSMQGLFLCFDLSNIDRLRRCGEDARSVLCGSFS